MELNFSGTNTFTNLIWVWSQQLVSVLLCNPQVFLHLYKPYNTVCFSLGEDVLSSSTAGPPPTNTSPTGKCVQLCTNYRAEFNYYLFASRNTSLCFSMQNKFSSVIYMKELTVLFYILCLIWGKFSHPLVELKSHFFKSYFYAWTGLALSHTSFDKKCLSFTTELLKLYNLKWDNLAD